MKKKHMVTLILAVLVLTVSCSGEKPDEIASGESYTLKEKEIRVVFIFQGNGRPTSDELDLLEKIGNSIAESNAGEIITTSSGKGRAELVIKMNQVNSVNLVKRNIITMYPGARYRIEYF